MGYYLFVAYLVLSYLGQCHGKLESIWSQLHYATRTLSPVRVVLKVTLFLLLYCTGVFLCIWGVLTRLELTSISICISTHLHATTTNI